MNPEDPPGSLDARILGELRAIPERDDHAAGLEEDDVVVRAAALPAQCLIEGRATAPTSATPSVMSETRWSIIPPGYQLGP